MNRKCGQCQFYMGSMRDRCPHQERTAMDTACERFQYTNPEQRIEYLQAEIDKLCEAASLYKELTVLLEKLLVCYRIGKRPSCKLLDRISLLRTQQAALKE